MARYLSRHRTTLIALLIVALASGGLTACGSSSDPTTSQARAVSPQLAAARRAALLELVVCARRHGVHLPTPTAKGLNVSGVKGRRDEEVVSACYQQTLKKVASVARAERTSQGGGAAGPATLGEGSPAG